MPAGTDSLLPRKGQGLPVTLPIAVMPHPDDRLGVATLFATKRDVT